MSLNAKIKKFRKVVHLNQIKNQIECVQEQASTLSVPFLSPRRTHASQNISLVLNDFEKIIRTSRNTNLQKESRQLFPRFRDETVIQKSKCTGNMSHNVLPLFSESNAAKNQQIDILLKHNENMRAELSKCRRQVMNIKEVVQPYVNNVNLMAAVFDSIQNREPAAPKVIQKSQQENLRKNEIQFLLNHELTIQKTKNIDNLERIQKLKAIIDSLTVENSKLKSALREMEIQFAKSVGDIQKNMLAISVKERMQMACEEIYSLRQLYSAQRSFSEKLKLDAEKMKAKIKLMTSLIGCAVVSDQNIIEKTGIAQFVDQIDRNFNVGFEQGDKSEDEQGTKAETRRKLRRLQVIDASYLQDNDLLGTQLHQQRIQPTFFTTLRGILDCKYIDFVLNKENAYGFPEFTSIFLKNYMIGLNKRVTAHTRTVLESEAKTLNQRLNRMLHDSRVSDLNQITTFREFLLQNTEKDEVFFYLICRHKLAKGSQLEDFISTGDPKKYIHFDHAQKVTLEITELFGKSTKMMISAHLNVQRVSIGGRMLVKVYYLLRVLLQVYRKYKQMKISKIAKVFEDATRLQRRPVLLLSKFAIVLKRCFDISSRNTVCNMYRATAALFKSQAAKETTFFQCFIAANGEGAFLQEMFKLDDKLSLLLSTPAKKKEETLNWSAELFPNSVFSLGVDHLRREYMNLMEKDSSQLKTKIEITGFLQKIVLGQFIGAGQGMENQQDLCEKLQGINRILLCQINRIEKGKLQTFHAYEEATRRIARAAKLKIFEFYGSFLQEIKDDKEGFLSSPYPK